MANENQRKQKSRIPLSALLKGIFLALCIIVLLELCSNIALSWTIISIAACYALWHVVNQGRNWWLGRDCKIAQRERFLKLLASLMGLFLTTGSILFLLAFQHEQNMMWETYQFVNAEYLLRSIVCSLDLFMLDIDSNVLDTINDQRFLKGLISVQAILSFACTVAVFISLVYARMMAYIKLHKQTTIDNEHNHLFLFFGLNEPSRQLAKSIKDKEGERAQIIIVENSRIDEEDHGGWNSIVGLFAHRKQAFSDVEELDARITFTESRLCDIDKDQTQQFDVLGEMNLRKLREYIQKLGSVKDGKLHVFFLSENEDENIHSLSVLALDKTINTLKNQKTTQRFYCHARRNGLNKVIEDIVVKQGLEVHTIDSSHLSVELLKVNELYHPVQLVEINKENPTTVASEFHSLIVGFDEAGQDALRFLYEFGAFVDNKSTTGEVKRSPFYCTAVDLRMKQLSGVFRAFTPAVMKQVNSDGKALLRLEEYDCQSGEFYEKILKPTLTKLNYVVIAVGDDELNMTCAIRIFNYVRRSREDLRHFRIFVRSYRSDKEAYMQNIADHYNEGYNTDCDTDRKKEYKTAQIIIPFGQTEKIYSYDMIVNEELTKKGKMFQESYARMRGEDLWDNRRTKLLSSKISLNAIRRLRRQESQDLANALHAGTKLYLLRQTQPDEYDWKSFLYRYFEEDGKKPKCEGSRALITYPNLSNIENKAIFNLACLEHLRWNASHEMLGYERAGNNLHRCDERTRQHNCLRPWQELDEESIAASTEGWDADYKLFDFGVVDNTLLLHKEKLLTPLESEEKREE